MRFDIYIEVIYDIYVKLTFLNNMTTQVIFKIDKKLKEQAMKKAQREGVPFALVLKFITKAFVEGQFHVGLVGTEKFNFTTRREITSALQDITKGKNMSPGFSSVKAAVKYLNR
ncbi:MAG: hypothetical protein A2826_00855 [Candidatus Doudnabacteria bacterium RIFCSPHIGHO2_01_FULL_43_23]|uniref:Uncharacterized protein n=1 Tax=Candidatus Doudnabacteria bacterium RIFCSPHIGHO2_01_FULL_43_23 TaxID=1817822 RepID=A0A1F5NR17_9BACT|nr:MAG: hypothetical protein A2826_00855 [Candidatus Doudnabacteria bacterium RIFCSPHIGHO2_01_FULL_43_23]